MRPERVTRGQCCVPVPARRSWNCDQESPVALSAQPADLRNEGGPVREVPGSPLQAEASAWVTGLEVGEPREELSGGRVGTGAGTPGLRGCGTCACRTGVWAAHLVPAFQEQTLGIHGGPPRVSRTAQAAADVSRSFSPSARPALGLREPRLQGVPVPPPAAPPPRALAGLGDAAVRCQVQVNLSGATRHRGDGNGHAGAWLLVRWSGHATSSSEQW